MKVTVDRDLCIGYAECMRLAPKAFAIDDEQLVVLLDPDAADGAGLREAEQACPSGAIFVDP